MNVTLDAFGNAIAALWSVHCRAGETHIRATLDAPPNTIVETSFTVLPPIATSPRLTLLPSKQVAAGQAGVATLVETGFENGAGKQVEVHASNLFHRCKTKPHLHWLYQGKERAGGNQVRITADYNGNAFALVLGGPMCTAGESLILAELIDPPYTQYVSDFLIEPPREVL